MVSLGRVVYHYMVRGWARGRATLSGCLLAQLFIVFCYIFFKISKVPRIATYWSTLDKISNYQLAWNKVPYYSYLVSKTSNLNYQVFQWSLLWQIVLQNTRPLLLTLPRDFEDWWWTIGRIGLGINLYRVFAQQIAKSGSETDRILIRSFSTE